MPFPLKKNDVGLGLKFPGTQARPVFFVMKKMNILFPIIIFMIGSCDPIKRIASDPAKLAKIAPEVIRAGYCIPDTIEVKKTDTITKFDTTEIPVMIPDTIAQPGDTIRMIEVKRKIVRSVKYITNTITKTTRDTATLNRLNNDLIMARDSIKIMNAEIRERVKDKRRDVQLMGALATTALIAILALIAIIRFTSKK